MIYIFLTFYFAFNFRRTCWIAFSRPYSQGKFSDRQTFLIDGNGTVVGHWLERDRSMANVKTPAHTEQIIAAIDSL